MNPLFRRAAWATALLVAGGASLSAQTAANAQPIVLPEFSTFADRELPPAPVWQYGRVGGHEVLSSASPGRTKRTLDDLNRFIHALNLTGTPLLPRQPGRLRLYLLARADEFARFTRDSTPEGTTGRPDSYSFKNAEGGALVLDLRARMLEAFSDSSTPGENEPAAPADAGPMNEAFASITLRAAYARFLLQQQRPELPPWFIEGFAQVLTFVRVTENSVTLGAIEDPAKVLNSVAAPEPGRSVLGNLQFPNQRSRDSLDALADFNVALATTALLPIPEIVSRRAEDFRGRDIAEAVAFTRWSKQCHALVHWGLFGDYGRNHDAFLRLVQRLSREPFSDALLKETLELDSTQLLVAMRTHIDSTRAKVQGVRAGPGEKLPTPPPFETREATPLEAARLQAIVFNLGGQPEKAREELALAYRRGERSPDLVAELALAELSLGQAERGRRYLDLAIKGKTTRARAYATLARLRLDERLAKPQAPGGKLSYEQLVGVLEPILLARQAEVRSPELYLLLAEAWARAAVSPPPAQLALLDEGVQLYPREPSLRAARELFTPAVAAPAK